jgi:hypothetical protein
VKGYSKVVTQSCQLEIGRGSECRLLAKEPKSPLKGAEDLESGGEEETQTFVPGSQEFAIEGCVMGHKLRDFVGIAVACEHRNCGMTP